MVEEEISRDNTLAAECRVAWIEEIPSLAISDKATELAEMLLTQGAVPTGSEEDALHIAIAAAQGVDYLLTWNLSISTMLK